MCKAMASEGMKGSIAVGGDKQRGEQQQEAQQQPPVAMPPPPPAAEQQAAAVEQPQHTQPQPVLQQQQPSGYPQQLAAAPASMPAVGGTGAAASAYLQAGGSSEGSAAGGTAADASLTAHLQQAMQQMSLAATGAAYEGLPSTTQQGEQRPAAGLYLQQPLQQQQQQQLEEPATLFFAKVPRTATKEQIQALFAAFGQVDSVNLFAPYEGAPSSKGCGLVVMRSYGDAAAVIAGLEHYKWEGMHSSMVIKLMGPQRQRQEQLLHSHQLETAASGGSSSGLRSPAHASSSRLGPAPSGGRFSSPSQMRMVVGMDMPPPGCAADAYKLFVGNIPRVYTEPDLLPIFESIGPVKELVVLRDRATQESKGSAFVWYTSGADADKAQATFNLQLVLQQRSGTHSKPLVVRRAVPGRQQGQLAGASVAGIPSFPAAQAQQAYAAAMQQGSMLNPSYGSPMGPAGQGGYSYAAAGQQLQATYFDAGGGAMPSMQPAAAYVQQQQPQPAQMQQQQLWQQQQQAPPVVHCQGMPAAPQYGGAPVLLSVSDGPSAAAGAAYPVMQLQPQGSWAQQQQQQQPAFVASGSYDLAQMPGGAGGLPVSGALVTYPVDYMQQQQSGLQVMQPVQQAVPTCQAMSGGASQTPILSGGSIAPASGNVLLAGSGPSSSSSAGLMAVSYRQAGSQQHSITIPLSADALNMINSQLGKVAAMSGAHITAEHNFACGSLALNVVAGSQEQLSVAWQYIQSLLNQQQQQQQAGGATAQVADPAGMM